MSPIRLHGVPWSRASRCLWMLEEIGARYENVAVADTRSREHLARNPNGRVPVLEDGPLVMWESLAINLHLAKRFPSDLSPKSLSEEAQALDWSFWAESELERHFNEIPGDWLADVLGKLEAALEKGPHLIAPRFTVADLNVANMFNGPVSSRLDFGAHPRASAWLQACRSRPAARRVFQRAAEAWKASRRE